VHDADLKARVTGRTATVTIGQGHRRHAGGRKITLSDFTFEVPDMARNRRRRRSGSVDCPVPAAVEILLPTGSAISPARRSIPTPARGNVSAMINLGMPVKGELTKADTIYSVTADIAGVAVDKLVMNQKLEATTLKVIATNAATRSRATSRSTPGGDARLPQAGRGRTPTSGCRRRS